MKEVLIAGVFTWERRLMCGCLELRDDRLDVGWTDGGEKRDDGWRERNFGALPPVFELLWKQVNNLNLDTQVLFF